MTKRKHCFVCKELIEEEDQVSRFESGNRAIYIHPDCFNLFGMLVRATIKSEVAVKRSLADPDYSKLPHVSKEKDSESEAIEKVLAWATQNHPRQGLTSSEIDAVFRDRYRWKLSNAAARLGELVEQGLAWREREGRSYRYFSSEN